MDPINRLFFIITAFQSVWQCDGVSLREQLEHIALRRRESQGIPVALPGFLPSRRYYDFHPSRSSVILGAPSMASHLPEAEPILPGHTLIRPSLDMLKSSIKFPHRDMDNGAGVYGNIDNLSIRWDGRNDRVLYTGFRRMNDHEGTMAGPEASRYDVKDNSYDALLAALLSQRKKKRVKENKANKNNRLYQSIYSNKGGEPKIIILPRFEPEYNIVDRIRNGQLLKLNKGNEQQIRSLRKRSYKNRLIPRTSASYAYLNLDDIKDASRASSTRENHPTENELAILLKHSDEAVTDADHEHVELSEIEGKRPNANDNVGSDPKQTWFWNSKDIFDHIKIRPDAPSLVELIPVGNTDDSKKWWFYHEADFEPFEKL